MDRIDQLTNVYRLYVFATSDPASFYDEVNTPQVAAGTWLTLNIDQVKIIHIEFQFFPTAIKISNSAYDVIIEDCGFQWVGIGLYEGALAGWPANRDAINMQGRGTSPGSTKIVNNYIYECGVHGIYINSQTTNTLVENING